MLIIRNLIYWFILSSSIILLFPFMLLALPFQGGAHKMAQVWVRILNWSLKHVIGLNYTLSGAENIPDRPAIICAKHQSGWETLALQEIFPPQVYVAKRELFKIPFFGWGLKLVKTIGIDRSNSREANRQLIEQGIARKNEGYWITISPKVHACRPAKKAATSSAARVWPKCLRWTSSPSRSTAASFGRATPSSNTPARSASSSANPLPTAAATKPNSWPNASNGLKANSP